MGRHDCRFYWPVRGRHLDGDAGQLWEFGFSSCVISRVGRLQQFKRHRGLSRYTHTAHADGTVSFDWAYQNFDIGFFPLTDQAYFVLNGTLTELPSLGGDDVQNGTSAFLVGSGDVFGFRQATLENLFGRADLNIRSFEFADAATAAPEPASLTLLGLGLVGMGARRWRKRKAS